MARIVLGLATSHSPQLSTPAELWPLHGERDKHNPHLIDTDGFHVSYDELLAKADPALAKEVTAEKWQARHEACQGGIASTRGRRKFVTGSSPRAPSSICR
jgi:hypothetical protein